MAETRKTTADIATSDAFRMGLDDLVELFGGIDTDRDFDGVIETANPETGEPELIGYWLPSGVTIADDVGGAP